MTDVPKSGNEVGTDKPSTAKASLIDAAYSDVAAGTSDKKWKSDNEDFNWNALVVSPVQSIWSAPEVDRTPILFANRPVTSSLSRESVPGHTGPFVLKFNEERTPAFTPLNTRLADRNDRASILEAVSIPRLSGTDLINALRQAPLTAPLEQPAPPPPPEQVASSTENKPPPQYQLVQNPYTGEMQLVVAETNGQQRTLPISRNLKDGDTLMVSNGSLIAVPKDVTQKGANAVAQYVQLRAEQQPVKPNVGAAEYAAKLNATPLVVQRATDGSLKLAPTIKEAPVQTSLVQANLAQTGLSRAEKNALVQSGPSKVDQAAGNAYAPRDVPPPNTKADKQAGWNPQSANGPMNIAQVSNIVRGVADTIPGNHGKTGLADGGASASLFTGAGRNISDSMTRLKDKGTQLLGNAAPETQLENSARKIQGSSANRPTEPVPTSGVGNPDYVNKAEMVRSIPGSSPQDRLGLRAGESAPAASIQTMDLRTTRNQPFTNGTNGINGSSGLRGGNLEQNPGLSGNTKDNLKIQQQIGSGSGNATSPQTIRKITEGMKAQPADQQIPSKGSTVARMQEELRKLQQPPEVQPKQIPDQNMSRGDTRPANRPEPGMGRDDPRPVGVRVEPPSVPGFNPGRDPIGVARPDDRRLPGDRTLPNDRNNQAVRPLPADGLPNERHLPTLEKPPVQIRPAIERPPLTAGKLVSPDVQGPPKNSKDLAESVRQIARTQEATRTVGQTETTRTAFPPRTVPEKTDKVAPIATVAPRVTEKVSAIQPRTEKVAAPQTRTTDGSAYTPIKIGRTFGADSSAKLIAVKGDKVVEIGNRTKTGADAKTYTAALPIDIKAARLVDKAGKPADGRTASDTAAGKRIDFTAPKNLDATGLRNAALRVNDASRALTTRGNKDAAGERTYTVRIDNTQHAVRQLADRTITGRNQLVADKATAHAVRDLSGKQPNQTGDKVANVGRNQIADKAIINAGRIADRQQAVVRDQNHAVTANIARGLTDKGAGNGRSIADHAAGTVRHSIDKVNASAQASAHNAVDKSARDYAVRVPQDKAGNAANLSERIQPLTARILHDTLGGKANHTADTGSTVRSDRTVSGARAIADKGFASGIREIGPGRDYAAARLQLETKTDKFTIDPGQIKRDLVERTHKSDRFVVRTGELNCGEQRYLTGIELLLAGLATISAVARSRAEHNAAKLVDVEQEKASLLPGLSIENWGGDQEEETLLELALKRNLLGNADKSKVLTRPKYMVQPGDTLTSIAEEIMHDAMLGWLILQINAGALKSQWNGDICLVEVESRQEIELPVAQDIVDFYRSRPAMRYKNKRLVTTQTQSSFDRELLVSNFRNVISTASAGLRKPQESPAV